MEHLTSNEDYFIQLVNEEAARYAAAQKVTEKRAVQKKNERSKQYKMRSVLRLLGEAVGTLALLVGMYVILATICLVAA